MRVLAVFVAMVLVYSVANMFEHKASAGTYQAGVEALLERGDVHGGRVGLLKRGPAVEIKRTKKNVSNQY